MFLVGLTLSVVTLLSAGGEESGQQHSILIQSPALPLPTHTQCSVLGQLLISCSAHIYISTIYTSTQNTGFHLKSGYRSAVVFRLLDQQASDTLDCYI